MWDLRGKNVVVTGAAGGIGRALALALAREGANLYLLDIDEAGLAEVVARAQGDGVTAIGQRCDLADPAAIHQAVETLLKQWPKVEVLVNNAGVCYTGPTAQMSEGQWDRLLQINLLAPLQLIRELLPTLLRQERAHILNVCSIAGLVGFSRFALYGASKSALVRFSEALRMEHANGSLGVTALCPGFVRTNLLKAPMQPADARPLRPPPAWMSVAPDTIAAHAVRAIRANRGLVVVPRWARLLWILHRLSPSLMGLLRRLGKRVSKVKKWIKGSRNAVAAKATPGEDAAGGPKQDAA